MDDSELRDLVEPIMRHLFAGALIGTREEDNLRTALGVAPFREYLAARIVRRLLDHLA